MIWTRAKRSQIGYNAYDKDLWILKLVDFVGTVLATTKKPIVGTCFGHQIMGRVLGANVGVNPNGWELSVVKVDFNEAGQKLFGVPSAVRHYFTLANPQPNRIFNMP